jgi:hypothetical protein
LRPGAGIFSWKFNGTPAPLGMQEDSSGNENPRGYKAFFPNQDVTDTAIYRHSGSIGHTGIGGWTWYTDFFLSPGQLRANKGYVFANLPEYFSNSPIGGGRIMPPWTVLSVRFLDCGNTEPPPTDPPPPPPEDDCCRMGCCPKPTEIDYKLIEKIVDRTLKKQKFTIEVPICKCELNKQTNKWTPKTDNVQMEVFATSKQQADQLAQLHLDNARQAADLCLARNVEEPIAVIPEWWQVRAFQRPQLVIQYAELLGDNKLGRSRWSVTIPHYNKPQNNVQIQFDAEAGSAVVSANLPFTTLAATNGDVTIHAIDYL